MKKFLVCSFVLFLTVTNSFSQGLPEKQESLTSWYQALEKADAATLESLMISEDFSPFEYDIKDLGVKQNRAEFIASMAEWLGAIQGGSIDYKITDAYEGGYTALVCYHFSGSDLLVEEEIGVYDAKITGVTQVSKGDTCEGF